MLDLFKNIIRKKDDPKFSIDPALKKYYGELSSRYTLMDKLGEGAFSIVFKAFDSELKSYVAIKIIDKTNMKSEQINSSLKEIAIMRHLSHKNIVKLLDHQNSTSSTYCFLFLEYLEGGEIFNQIIKYTYFSEDLSRFIIRQVAKSVKYLHDSSIVHRDIKPENLLFQPIEFLPRPLKEQLKARRKSDDNNKIDEGKFIKNIGGGGIGIVKLADFGLSTYLYNEDSKAKTPCGTVGYTSPEQHLNLGYNKKVDIWAIGCVLYTLVVGFPPFYSNNQDTKDISLKVSKGDYKFLSPWFDEVSDECKNLISNLLTVDPEKRYSIDELLRDPWIVKGCEDELNEPIEKSVAADDAPTSTICDKDLFNTFSDNLISTKNVGDYFGENRSDSIITTPRAEAIKLVFDTANVVQRSSNPNLQRTKSTSLTMDTLNLSDMRLRRSSLSDYDDTDDISELETEIETEDESDENQDSIPEAFTLSKVALPKSKNTSMVEENSSSSVISPSHSTTTATTATFTSPSDDTIGSITTSEIEDHETGHKRKSLISFHLTSCSNSKSSRCSSIISANSESTSNHGIYFPKTPQPIEESSEEDETEFDRTPNTSRPRSLKKYDLTNIEKEKNRTKPLTPYIFKDSNENLDEQLEQNLQNRNESFDLKLNDSTILSRRKMKITS